MRSFVVFLAAFSLCQARPQTLTDGARSSFMMGGEQFMDGGTDASPGEFPWHLSLQRQGVSWSHICGASLLSSNYGLTAAHCVDGALPSNLRVVAGLHQQSDLIGTQTVYITTYQMHESYGVGLSSYSNDICILNFETPITIGGNIQPATLPADNSNSYAGYTCVMIGWDTGAFDDTLQKAPIEVITTVQCQSLMAGVGGANIWDNHICVYDQTNNVSNCGGDGGGSLNCPDDVSRVAGIGSWVVSSATGNCLRTYPSVFTRTSTYLDWIASHTS